MGPGREKWAAARGRSRRASATGNCAAAASIFNHAPDPAARARPLSPHLEIYRWQIGNTPVDPASPDRHRARPGSAGVDAIGWCRVAGGEHSYAMAAMRFASPVGCCVPDRLDLCVSLSPVERRTSSVLGCGLRLRAHPAARQRLVRGAGRAGADLWRMVAGYGTSRHEPAQSLGPGAGNGLGEGRHRALVGAASERRGPGSADVVVSVFAADAAGP